VRLAILFLVHPKVELNLHFSDSYSGAPYFASMTTLRIVRTRDASSRRSKLISASYREPTSPTSFASLLLAVRPAFLAQPTYQGGTDETMHS
jgi:hypothetical protein